MVWQPQLCLRLVAGHSQRMAVRMSNCSHRLRDTARIAAAAAVGRIVAGRTVADRMLRCQWRRWDRIVAAERIVNRHILAGTAADLQRQRYHSSGHMLGIGRQWGRVAVVAERHNRRWSGLVGPVAWHRIADLHRRLHFYRRCIQVVTLLVIQTFASRMRYCLWCICPRRYWRRCWRRL